MPKTTEQIWRSFCEQLGLEILEAGAKTRVEGWCRVYQEEKRKEKWYSEEELKVLQDDTFIKMDKEMLEKFKIFCRNQSEKPK